MSYVTSGVASVQLRQHEVTIPSAPVRLGRLPMIGRAAQDRPIHPYRMLSEIEFGRLEPRRFLALTLENEFLQLTVLPELGGRLHRALYKPANYDLFYYNDAIRAQIVSSRGAWYAGGVEFNFPTSHSLTTHAGVEYATRTLDDGSAAVIVSNTCRMSRMRWEVAISIQPGSSAIRFATRLINRLPWPHRYYYWLNAAVPQGPQIRYHFSASKLIGHTQEVDGVVTRLDNFPMLRNGSDARVPARLLDTTSVFMLDNNSGFLGYYDVDADLGLVRSAPVRNVPGNKIWSWGDTDYGNRFNDRLVPPGGQYYGELQSGRPESQTDWAIIEPFETIDAEETWYPIPGLGGMTDGSRDITILARPEEGKLRLIANRDFPHLRVCVKTSSPGGDGDGKGGTFCEHALENVRADRLVQLDMPRTSQPIQVTVKTSDGRVAMDYRDLATQPKSIIVDLYETKAAMVPPKTAHELTVRGVLHYRCFEYVQAEEALKTALAIDSEFGPAHRWLAFMLRLRGRFAEAAEHLKKALLNDPMDYAAYYQYAALLSETGPDDQAALELERVIGYAHGQFREWAAVLLARKLLRLGRLDEARRLLNERPADVAFGPLGRLAYRLAPSSGGESPSLAGGESGRGGSSPAANSPWWNPTTDLFVQLVQCSADERVDGSANADLPRSAATRSSEGAQGSAWLNGIAQTLDAWYAGNVKSIDEAADAALVVAEELLDVADDNRARVVLDWLTSHETLGRACPLAHYRLGELNHDLPAAVGRAGKLIDRLIMAWPSALCHLPLLERAVAAAPEDALAQSLLGMLRLALNQPAEAIDSLEKAVRLDHADALAWRNLGLALWQAGGTNAPAEDAAWHRPLDAYKRAVELWPDYPPLLFECDRMLAELRAPIDERRALLYDRLHPSLVEDDGVAGRRANLALASGEFASGLAAVTGTVFHPGEGRFDTHRLFMRLSVREGERLADCGDWTAALTLFRQALEYPKNIQMGRPRRAQESRQLWLIATALRQLGDQAAAAAELEKLVSSCLRYVPVELYFGVLALRALGRDEQADQWLKLLVEQTDRRSAAATSEGRYWAAVGQALIDRAKGNRAASNDRLASLNPRPGDDMADFLASKLY